MTALRCSRRLGRRMCKSQDLTVLGYKVETPAARTFVWGTAFQLEPGPGLEIVLHCNACSCEWTSPAPEAFEYYNRTWSESEGPEAAGLVLAGAR